MHCRSSTQSEPSDANRFASAEQYFPTPDTTLTANIGYYLGRTDRVMIDENKNIIVRAGKSRIHE